MMIYTVRCFKLYKINSSAQITYLWLDEELLEGTFPHRDKDPGTLGRQLRERRLLHWPGNNPKLIRFK